MRHVSLPGPPRPSNQAQEALLDSSLPILQEKSDESWRQYRATTFSVSATPVALLQQKKFQGRVEQHRRKSQASRWRVCVLKKIYSQPATTLADLKFAREDTPRGRQWLTILAGLSLRQVLTEYQYTDHPQVCVGTTAR